MHSKIVRTELLQMMAKYTLPFNKSQNHITTNIYVVRIITSKQQQFSQSDPVLIRQFSKKLQSDPVLVRAHLC